MFVLKVKKTPELWPELRERSGTPETSYDHVELMQWLHLNIFDKQSRIVCVLPRGHRANEGTVRSVIRPRRGAAINLPSSSRP